MATAEKIKATMAELSKSFPSGLKYDIIYNPTEFIQQSVDAVVETILEAVVLVVLVVFVSPLLAFYQPLYSLREAQLTNIGRVTNKWYRQHHGRLVEGESERASKRASVSATNLNSPRTSGT